VLDKVPWVTIKGIGVHLPAAAIMVDAHLVGPLAHGYGGCVEPVIILQRALGIGNAREPDSSICGVPK
jgi:hypothetical protein